MSMTCILIIYWFLNVLVKSSKGTYHSVTLNCSRYQYHNTAHDFERMIYDRNGDKKMNILSGLFLMTTRYWKRCIQFDNQNIISLPSFFCYQCFHFPTTMLITSNSWKFERKINGWITKKTVIKTCILIIDLLKMY